MPDELGKGFNRSHHTANHVDRNEQIVAHFDSRNLEFWIDGDWPDANYHGQNPNVRRRGYSVVCVGLTADIFGASPHLCYGALSLQHIIV